MHKLLTLVLAAGLGLGLAACQQSQPQTSVAPGVETVTIQVTGMT